MLELREKRLKMPKLVIPDNGSLPWAAPTNAGPVLDADRKDDEAAPDSAVLRAKEYIYRIVELRGVFDHEKAVY